jgi:CRISPR type III-A-associated RAMP protein Csm5
MKDQLPIRQNHRCVIEAITPIHIGNGDKLQQDIDFFHDRNAIHVIHRQRLFNEIQKMGKSGITEFSRAIEDGRMADWIRRRKLLNIVRAYSAPFGNNRPPSSITIQLRDGLGRPLVPGSSLKGSIRTAVILKLAREDSNKMFLHREIESYSKRQPELPKFPDQGLCRKLLGETPNENLMRCLTISDVTFEPSEIALQMISMDRMISAERMSTKFPIFVESVQAGSKGSGQLSFDLYLKEADRHKKCFDFKVSMELSVLLQAIRQRTKQAIGHEIEFFKKLNGVHCHELVAFYKELSERQETLPENQTLLQLGWGSGWMSMTGPLLTQEDLKQNKSALRENLKLAYKHLKFPFPKSRKVSSITGHSVPMGWILLCLTPMEEIRRQDTEHRVKLRHSEQVQKDEIDAEQRRQAELAALPEEERRLLLLERGELQENEVVALYNQIDGMGAQIQKRTAIALKDYWQKAGKWNKKDCSKKQAIKVAKVKMILGEA